jgi:FlaA1/EpsC-like NDP-sugar epimerase
LIEKFNIRKAQVFNLVAAEAGGAYGVLGTPGRNGEGATSYGRPSRDPWEAGSKLEHLLRRGIVVVLAAAVLTLSRWLAYEFRFDFAVPLEYQVQLYKHWVWVVPLQLAWLFVFKQFSGIYKYFSLPEIRSLALAMFCSGLSLYSLRYVELGYYPPRGVILVQCMFGFVAIGGMRTAWRVAHERYYSRKRTVCLPERKIAIIGAGDAGASLVRELYARPHLGLVPVAFLDDNEHKWGSNVHGVPVIGAPEDIGRKKEKLGLEEVVIAMPSASPKRLGEVVGLLQKARLNYVTVPSIDQLTSGAVSISQLRPVRIEDLLGRESIDLRLDEIGGVLKGRTVIVTGAGGSIGSELCRQVASFHPQRLLLVEQSEVQLFQIEQQLIKLGYGPLIVPIIGDILDRARMRAVIRQYRPTVVFHAAAHKHVHMMEIQPGEAIKNNCLGTASLAELAVEFGVERFVMISTDKAVNPMSVMGATKRLAEISLQAVAQEHPESTKFVAVRFGNVLGSSGSVIPIFERQIAEGGPVTVTHPEVTRYFMTTPEAVGLVLQSCAMGQGGEVFILDMGKPVKIAELAHQMIRLSGLQPGRDIEIQFIGLRPGEKLCEELRHLQANCTPTAHPRILRLTSEKVNFSVVCSQLAELQQRLNVATPEELKSMMKKMLPEYTPALVPNSPRPWSDVVMAGELGTRD